MSQTASWLWCTVLISVLLLLSDSSPPVMRLPSILHLSDVAPKCIDTVSKVPLDKRSLSSGAGSLHIQKRGGTVPLLLCCILSMIWTMCGSTLMLGVSSVDPSPRPSGMSVYLALIHTERITVALL